MYDAQREIYNQINDSDDPRRELEKLLEFMIELHNTWVDNDKQVVPKVH